MMYQMYGTSPALIPPLPTLWITLQSPLNSPLAKGQLAIARYWICHTSRPLRKGQRSGRRRAHFWIFITRDGDIDGAK